MIDQPQSKLSSLRNSPLRPKLRTILIQKKPSLLETPIEPSSANSIAKRRETVVKSLINKFKETTSTQVSLASKRENKAQTPIKINSMKETLNFKRTQVFQFRNIELTRRTISKSYENNSVGGDQPSVDRPSARGSPDKAPSLVNTSRKHKVSIQNLSAKRPVMDSSSTDATIANFTTRGFSFEDKVFKRGHSNLRLDSILPEILTPTKVKTVGTRMGHKRIQSQRV